MCKETKDLICQNLWEIVILSLKLEFKEITCFKIKADVIPGHSPINKNSGSLQEGVFCFHVFFLWFVILWINVANNYLFMLSFIIYF